MNPRGKNYYYPPVENGKIITTRLNDSDESSVEDFPNYKNVFVEPRHMEEIKGHGEGVNQNWRTKERMKTVSVGIVLCLNVGVDPPDIIKPQPHAVIQCWTDPFASTPTTASETIANNLIKQYGRLQPRPRYKHCVDPKLEDVKKLCTSLRRSSKEERVLFHYNGHGVPKPTPNGEIWVFNRNYTKYIPLSLYDLQQWMGSPSIYVFDCSCAGTILETFQHFAIQHKKEYEMNMNSPSFMNKESDLLDANGKIAPPPNYHNCILLAACSKGEILPLHPDLPADLFTSCLTTPIKTYLVWFLKHNSRKLTPEYTMDFIDSIPGQADNRKSILGELNWIFTAVTDTIAWNTLPRELFQRLFRQDSLVASLFRNFLLAQRIMRSYDCTPLSTPFIKSTHKHPMWEAWDLAVDHCLSQLFKPDIKDNPQIYTPSPFFAQQLTAFQVWLKLDAHSRNTPEKLPIVLQVLLSQAHRSRALDLLGNFLNLGSWAVNLALSLGIFPYVLKLLQASARELRPFLVFIWAKILAVDESSQNELIRENAHRYFMNVLSDSNISINHQVMSAFVLSVMIRQNPAGQRVVNQNNPNYQFGSIIDIAMNLLMDETYNHSDLRKWLIICLGNVWENNEEIRWLATRNAVYEKLYSSLNDPVPEVRTATVFALGTFINSITQRNEHANEIDRNIVSTLLQKVSYDSSPLVRKELLVTLHWFILIFESNFLPIFRKKAFEEHISRQFNPDTSLNHSLNQSLNIPNNLSPVEAINFKPDTSYPPVYHMRQESREKMFNKLLTVPENPNQNDDKHELNTSQMTPPGNNIKHASSLSSSSQSLSSIFDRVWQVIELYKLDPHPDVAQMAQTIYSDTLSKAFTVKERSDSSEPSSPTNRPKYLSTESPVAASAEYIEKAYAAKENVKHHSGRVSVSAFSSPYLPHSNNYTYFINQYTMKRKIFGKDPLLNEKKETRYTNGMFELSKESLSSRSNSISDSLPTCRKPLISTTFVDWCTKQFSQPCSHAGICCSNAERSNTDPLTEWRTKRIKDQYLEAKRNLNGYLDENLIGSRKIKQFKKCLANYSIFHPFEKYLIMANESTISIVNYSQESNDQPYMFKNDNLPGSQISDLEIINTHEKALLLVASDDSSIKIWRNLFPLTFPEISIDDYEREFDPSSSNLSTAFFMFEDLPLRGNSQVLRKRFIVDWNEYRQNLIGGGDNKFIRIWDANHEKKIRDISVGSDVVTSISTDFTHYICVGCEDGAVRVFDDRITANDSRVLSFSGRLGPVIGAKLWPQSYSDSINLVSGHRTGEVCWYDRRFVTKAVRVETNDRPMTAMDWHNLTDVFTCAFGLDNSEIQFFSLDSIKGPIIKSKNRNVLHLKFHPLKPRIAISTSDSIVTILKTSMRHPHICIL